MSIIDARPTTVDLKLYAGDDFRLLVRLIDPDSGAPVDLTGVVGAAQIRDEAAPAGTLPLATFTVSVGAEEIELHLPAQETTDADPDAGWPNAVWDLQITWPDTTVVTVSAGRVYLTEDVTR